MPQQFFNTQLRKSAHKGQRYLSKVSDNTGTQVFVRPCDSSSSFLCVTLEDFSDITGNRTFKILFSAHKTQAMARLRKMLISHAAMQQHNVIRHTAGSLQQAIEEGRKKTFTVSDCWCSRTHRGWSLNGKNNQFSHNRIGEMARLVQTGWTP